MNEIRMERMDGRPIIGITMGDPAGIGPEIIAKALGDPGIYQVCIPVVFGDLPLMDRALRQFCTGLKASCVPSPLDAKGTHGIVEVFQIMELGDVIPGSPDPENARPMVEYIRQAVSFAKERTIHAMVTCPINKELMHRAGFRYQGHTQLIAEMCHKNSYVMMLAGPILKVSLVTIHHALKEVPGLITKERVLNTILITHEAMLTDLGLANPRIAVAGLNPHNGEGGLFGSEESLEIQPAVKMARERGLEVSGPISPDTVFFRAYSGEFDVVVAMYHDQGLIPIKLLHFEDAVNVTLGLPIIRTSVDHGTAYEIAGKGIARPSSLRAAIHLAANMCQNRIGRTKARGAGVHQD